MILRVGHVTVLVHFKVLAHKPRQLGADARLLGGDGEYREQTQRHAAVGYQRQAAQVCKPALGNVHVQRYKQRYVN